ncbi:MAG TPA: L-threonylcarbamoyladenylate synthase [Burkholderiales bacterium]|jgi:tRNA threonylcarbamoyl adenosine modification protein (Sua5/YciO/YrdC/YwlC family)|nr:L-threonylcarbamoyladenylate synthase [Burkholderiales bacterium]
MAQFLSVHATHPQKRLIRIAAEAVKQGGLVAYPTDSCYALGCDLGATTALERLRRIRGVDERHRLTLMCRDLAEISAYAIVDDACFRLLKRVTPGSYTFILPARRQVPRRATSRKTIGVRIPGHPAAHALLAELDAPMLSATLTVAGEAAPLADAQEIRARLEAGLDVIVDGGPCGVEPSTVIDLTKAEPQVLRVGKGSLAPFSVEPV